MSLLSSNAFRKEEKLPKKSAPTMTEFRKILILSFGLAILVAGIFGQTFHHDFVNYDDPLYVYENPRVLGGLTPFNVAWSFTSSYATNWHPLTWLSHMLDVELYGLNPSGHHLTSVLFHALNAVLLFWLLRQLTGSLGPSFFAAAFFAVHPLRVESVAWIAERKDVLSGFFFLLTLLAYVRYARLPWSPWRYALVFFLFAAGLMAKPMLVTLPLILLLLDFWPLRRLAPAKSEPAFRWKSFALSRRTILEKIPLLILVLGSCVATLLAQQEAVVSLANIPLAQRLANALVSCGVYLRQMVVPVDLAVLYPIPLKGVSFLPAFLSALGLLAISGATWFHRRRYPYLLIGWLWYLIMLIPVLGVVQVGIQAHADRYTYLPHVGLFLGFVGLVADATGASLHRSRILAGAATLLLGILAFLAHAQTSRWRNSFSLWNHALSSTTQNAVAHNNLAVTFLNANRTPEAFTHYWEALKIQPYYADALSGLGSAFEQSGNLEKARLCYLQALDTDPRHVVARQNLGLILSRMGRIAEAVAEYEKALEICPDSAEIHYNVANALVESGQADEAIARYQKALDIDPRHTGAWYNLGQLFQNQKKWEEAVEAFRHVLKINPHDAEAYNALGSVFHQIGQGEQALAAYEKAVNLRPHYAEAHNNLAVLFSQIGRSSEAIVHAGKALEINPRFAPTHYNLGRTLEAAGRTEEAILHYKQALEIQPDYVEARQRLDQALPQKKKVKTR
jgi:tetratricopeptide (TPR) repeat protein